MPGVSIHPGNTRLDCADEFVHEMMMRRRDELRELLVIDGIPGAGKTYVTETICEQTASGLIAYPMDYHIKHPQTHLERAVGLFDDFDRLYCKDDLVIEEICTMITQSSGIVRVQDAYHRNPRPNVAWEFADININLHEGPRTILFEGCGVNMLTDRIVETLPLQQKEDLNVVRGCVVMDLRTAILSALLRDIEGGGRVTDERSLKERVDFRIKDIVTAYQKRGVQDLIQSPHGLLVLNNQGAIERHIEEQLSQAA